MIHHYSLYEYMLGSYQSYLWAKSTDDCAVTGGNYFYRIVGVLFS